MDHIILLERLHELGIRDAALDWFKSYLSQRRQSVVINGTRSSHRTLFWSASGISTWPNAIHSVHNTTGRNSMEISAKFPSLCWGHTAVHGIQPKQCGLITHTTLAPCQSLDRFHDRIAGLQSPKWSSSSLYRKSPAALRSTLKLHSADKQLLSQPPCRLKPYGDRAFCCATPVVWNNILHSVKTAKTVDNLKVKLKTHFIMSHLHKDMLLLFNRDIHWLTLRLEQP